MYNLYELHLKHSVDMTWWAIQTLKTVGLAKKVVMPPANRNIGSIGFNELSAEDKAARFDLT